jgi:hypothetical protein
MSPINLSQQRRFDMNAVVKRAMACLTLMMTLPAFAAAQSNRTPAQPAKTNAAPTARHDLDGVWAVKVATTVPRTGFECCLVDPRLRPPMTAWGQARFDAAVPSSKSPGPEGDRVVPGKENDPALSCFPDGIPKILTSPEPFEIITVPGRVLMFFEKDHGWRQIWTDGRKLSDDPPELRFDGYSVGRWEADTFVVESNGFNDKLWLTYYGDPHSEAMHLTERYQRTDKDTLSIAVTVDDPKAYTSPWVGKPIRYSLRPRVEIGEWYCTLEDENRFNEKVRFPTFVPGETNK